MMRIKYLTNVRIPTTRAQGYAIVKMCSEFADLGNDVELIIPHRRDSDRLGDAFRYYKIRKNFTLTEIPGLDLLSATLRFGRIMYWIDMLSFLFMFRLRRIVNKDDLFYTRDFLTLLVLPKDSRIALELHDIPTSGFLFNRLIKKPKVLFVLNRHIKEELILRGIDESRIYISPSGVDIKEFDIGMSKPDARSKTNLPANKKIVLYSGQFYEWKGIDTLAETAGLLPDVMFVFIGGTEPELGIFKGKYKNHSNIVTLPFVDKSVVSLYLASADVLAVPNSAHTSISARYTSPLKLFEYMASRRPIVVSDLPSMREVVDETNCIFAEADNPQSFAAAITKALTDSHVSEYVENAYKDVTRYGWGVRAKNILNVVEAKF